MKLKTAKTVTGLLSITLLLTNSVFGQSSSNRKSPANVKSPGSSDKPTSSAPSGGSKSAPTPSSPEPRRSPKSRPRTEVKLPEVINMGYVTPKPPVVTPNVYESGQVEPPATEPPAEESITGEAGITRPPVEDTTVLTFDDPAPADVKELHAYVPNYSDQRSGMLIRPEAQAIWERDQISWLSTSPIIDEVYIYGANASYVPAAGQYIPADYLSLWKFYYMRFLYASPEWRKAYIDDLAREVVLDQNYRRVALRGQISVFARVYIAKYTIIGAYSGMMLKQGSPTGHSFDLRAELDHLRTINPKITADHIRRYAFNIPLTNTRLQGIDPEVLIVSALLRGNAIANVNSYWAPPETDADNQQDYNVDSALIRMDDHLPIVVYYARRDIPQDEELMTNYGTGYWQAGNLDQSDYSVPKDNMVPTFRFYRDMSDKRALWRLPVNEDIQLFEDEPWLNQVTEQNLLCLSDNEDIAIVEADLGVRIIGQYMQKCPRRKTCPRLNECPIVGEASSMPKFNSDYLQCCALSTVL